MESNETESNDSASSITISDVMSHAESPASDFEITDYGDSVIELSKYLGDDKIVVIPNSIGGKTITRIGAYVFSNDFHPNTKAVKLSDGIEIICTGAFGMNELLEIVVAGKGLKDIGEGAFQSCTNLKIIGKAGSVAETYAASASIAFETK